ncbi:sterol desaturase family protein [Paroceanicella profunda]|uniref:Sterol desaturase family protein n=1 Tax=Paroceanicella profunda TaxID=2579971 RepID=A0A5B8FSF8_9RHOB|nr:sterol desaturase family protein [Paroceanicella profunda]QDL91315.1 sterol desaturase family protein [Paroceanicella profunda]
MLLEFLATWGAVYIAMLAVYFATGLALTWWNARHPERRIQENRRGETRMAEEIRHSLSALALSSLLLGTGFFAQGRGWTPTPLELSWWSFPLGFVVSLVIFDAWFYFGHRLLHWKPLYRFHALHHKSVAPTVWSNDSSGLVDTLIEHGFYLVVWFVLPVPALSVFALRLFDQISGMIGHSGFEYFAGASSRAPSPMICSTFHDLHHSQFRYNFGNIFSIWDRLLGTVHPGYDAMVRRMESGETPGKATSRH